MTHEEHDHGHLTHYETSSERDDRQSPLTESGVFFVAQEHTATFSPSFCCIY